MNGWDCATPKVCCGSPNRFSRPVVYDSCSGEDGGDDAEGLYREKFANQSSYKGEKRIYPRQLTGYVRIGHKIEKKRRRDLLFLVSTSR